MRFGKTGMTFPLVTEHKGTCQYSTHKTLCPLPPDCPLRLPALVDHKKNKNEKIVVKLCREMPVVKVVGDFEVEKIELARRAAVDAAKAAKEKGVTK